MSTFFRKIGKYFSRHGDRTCVKSFNEDQAREEAYDTKDIGNRTVPVERIVGSVGRYNDFDGKFRLRPSLPSERLRVIKRMMREGKSLPPVRLYRIKNEYYVLDGNHRVSAAKELGRKEISAKIVEFIPTRNTLENILYREQSTFQEKTGLPEEIRLTEIGQYETLLKQIEKHRTFLESEKQSEVTIKEAATDWCDTIYQPLTDLIRKGRLNDLFPERTISDLYVYISVHQWEKRRRRSYGGIIDRFIPDNMEDFRKKMAESKKFDYPEMQREITAFVMMNVEAKKEFRVIEKIFTLDEVREVHSVHGSVDVIAKVVLTRDLLSSDAETISFFVHNNIRQLPGVINTQTLIPGFSRVKQ